MAMSLLLSLVKVTEHSEAVSSLREGIPLSVVDTEAKIFIE